MGVHPRSLGVKPSDSTRRSSPNMKPPFSQACENNRDPILEVLQPLFANSRRVLEIGSGTGQHAAHFAPAMPHLQWQTSDLIETFARIGILLSDKAKSHGRREFIGHK